MAEGKKSFIAYSDWYGMFKALPDEVAGKLIKHIFSYVNDENPSSDDFVINALFEQVKSTLKRDLKKWEEQQEQRRQAGLRSAEIRKQNATLVNDRSISSTVNDSVNVSVSDNVNVNNKETIKERKLKFAQSLIPYIDIYGKDMIRDFCDYWTESGEKDLKFRREKEKSFDIERRLRTWNNNNFKNKQNGKPTITTSTEFKQITDAIRSDGVRR